MTLPIVPGPWSFLREASDAGIDAYYRAQQRKDMLDQMKRQQDLQNVSLFTQLLPYMQPGQGAPTSLPGLPTPMGTTPPVTIPGAPGAGDYELPGGVAESFGRLGLGRPKLGKTAGMRKDESAARVSESLEQPTKRSADAGATLDEAKAAEVTALNEKWLPILQNLTPQQIMQQKGVMSPEVAELADKVALEKLQTESLAQDPTRKNLEVQGLIQESLLKRLPKDPNMQLLAGHAALGTLGYLIAGLQQAGDTNRMSIQANREKINMLNQITLTARQLLTKAQSEWDEGRKAAVNSLDIQTAPEKKKAKMMQDAIEQYETNTPKPDADAIFNQVQEQFGMSPEEFRQISRTLANLIGAPPEKAAAAPATTKRKITQDQADFLKARGRWDANLYEIIK